MTPRSYLRYSINNLENLPQEVRFNEFRNLFPFRIQTNFSLLCNPQYHHTESKTKEIFSYGRIFRVKIFPNIYALRTRIRIFGYFILKMKIFLFYLVVKMEGYRPR